VDSQHTDLDLNTLVDHKFRVQAGDRLADVYDLLRFEQIDFVAVLDQKGVLGLCSRSQLGTLLGQRYGFSLYHKQSARHHLTPSFLTVTQDEAITDILTKAMGRSKERFFDDVVLTETTGRYVGLIRMRTLIALQSRFFLENIEILESQQAELNRKTRQMEGELTLAGHLQRAILTTKYPCFPSDAPVSESMLRFHHIYQSASLLGGDFFHITRLSDSAAGVLICDVSGHGVKSALVTSMMRALLTSYHDLGLHPGKLLTVLNEKILHMLEGYQNGLFATACYMMIDLQKRSFKLGNAGHPSPVRLNQGKKVFQELTAPEDAEGPPIGILRDLKYKSYGGPIEEGDMFIFYTDGIYEIFNDEGEMFGLERFLDVLKKHMDRSSPKILAKMVEEGGVFSNKSEFCDDICLLTAKVFALSDQTAPPGPNTRKCNIA
jgi:sigma-B regulation protein RsbU (phosphoserine phosphatase)